MEVMPSSSRLLLWFITSLFALLLARAHSVVPEPLTYLEFVTNPSMEVLPRDHLAKTSIIRRDIYEDSSLRHDDSLRIQFIAFNRTFSIHLEPNLDLFHPEATITVHHSNNTKTTTRLRPEDHRLYKGVLLDIDSTDNRLNEDIIGLRRRSLSEELSYSSGVLGWARIQIHDDGGVTQYSKNNRHPTFEGTFSLNNELYSIKSIENFKLSQFKDDPEIPNPSARHHVHRSATMVIYRDSDVKNSKRSLQDVGSCAMDDIVSVQNRRRDRIIGSNNDWQSGQLKPWWSIGDHLLAKRDLTGCPTGRKIAYMASAADCTYVTNYNSPDAARKQILQDWGSASAVYEKTFNVTLGLIKMEILDQNCPQTPNSTYPFNRQCDDSYTINDRLNDFSQWRGTFPDDGASLWHLMSKCNTGTKVGVAWLGQLCQTKATQQDQGQLGQAIVSGTGVSTIVKDEWKVVAHEVGHGFGAIHDCLPENCPCNNCGCCPLSDTVCSANNQYIMNPTSNVVTDQFSPCSITDVCQSLPNIGGCLEDPGTKSILSQSMCGNGLKEDNEECDCGTSADCANDPCCDGTTCKLKGNAVCDDKNDMCCSNCQYKPVNEVCRPASSNCDIAEVCNGTSGDCPPDKHVEDGTTCAPNLACAGGQCTSRDNQCLLRGSRMGITKACSTLTDPSCTISCANPNDTNSCLQMSGYFVDGTPCGFGGRCNKGQCDSGSIGNTLSSWINQNKKIAIPIIVILGSLLLCCIIQCAYRCCNRRRPQTSKLRVPSLPPDDGYSRSNNYSNYNYNNYNNSYGARNGSNWVDPTPYNGYEGGSAPPMPTPIPAHQQQRSRSPDYAYAGTGLIHSLPPQSSQRPNVFDRPQVSPMQRSPSSPSSPNPDSSRSRTYNYPSNYPSNYPNNYPTNNDRQNPYRRQ
ncbi:zinc metalloprotease [Rhizophagus clarus]|uniref:Disintegrin and metalloproteinase domain-containing protein B n=1 Tax=Rhizophagus clarus TaxID=94130 RepID=A0A8H3QIT4_9GLOM|nr:zinc metalloprotease [Rhizophagus clarus]